MIITIFKLHKINRPFPSYFGHHYESEAKCKVFTMKISFHSYANKSNFHTKSFALSLVFIIGFTATRKLPIPWHILFALRYTLCNLHVGESLPTSLFTFHLLHYMKQMEERVTLGNQGRYLCDILNRLGEIDFQKLRNLQRIYGSVAKSCYYTI